MFCRHDFGWPRRVADVDVQTCTRCGATKKSKIQFGVPRGRILNCPKFIQFGRQLSNEELAQLQAAWKRGEVR